MLRTDTRFNAKLHHYALHGKLLHKVHAVPRRTTQEHTVPRCSTEVHTLQAVCYVPKYGTTRNYTTKYKRYHVGLLRYIRYHGTNGVLLRTVQHEFTPLRTARRGIAHSIRDTTSDYSGTYGTTM